MGQASTTDSRFYGDAFVVTFDTGVLGVEIENVAQPVRRVQNHGSPGFRWPGCGGCTGAASRGGLRYEEAVTRRIPHRLQSAGGTPGGGLRFLLGLAMMAVGGYLFLDSIRVSTGFGLGFALFGFGGFQLTSGMVLIPFIFGVGFIFYNSRNPVGWLLSGLSLAALIFGVIRTLRFHMWGMSAFDIIVIFVLLFGGVGLFLSSLRDLSSARADED